MVAVVPLMLMLLVVAYSSHDVQSAVQVKDGEFTYPLESVKKLKELLGRNESRPASPLLRSKTFFLTICSNPELPQELKGICEREDGPLLLKRLDLMVGDTDLCEICANAACSGCY